jgi:hypothetical protein
MKLKYTLKTSETHIDRIVARAGPRKGDLEAVAFTGL